MDSQAAHALELARRADVILAGIGTTAKLIECDKRGESSENIERPHERGHSPVT